MTTAPEDSNASTSTGDTKATSSIARKGDDDENDQICPFTYQSLSTNPADVAYIFDSVKVLEQLTNRRSKSTSACTTTFHCGHKCSFIPLMDYYLHRHRSLASSHDSGTNPKPICPVCQESPIAAVIDGAWMANRSLSNDDRNKNVIQKEEEGCSTIRNDKIHNNNVQDLVRPKIFSIKYGKLAIGLSIDEKRTVKRKRSFLWGGASNAPKTAQDKICKVLKLEPTTLKILFKGKIIYPNKKLTEIELSEHIISTSNGGNSILTVMGTQKQELIALPGYNSGQHTSTMSFFLSSFIPSTFYNFLGFPFRLLYQVAAFGFLFVKSIFIPPQHREED